MTRPEVRVESLGGKGAATAIGLAINGLCRFLMSWSVGRFAAPQDLGAFQASLSTAQFANLLGPTATASAASSFLARSGHSPLYRAEEVEYLLRRQVAVALLVVNVAYSCTALLALGTPPGRVAANVALICGIAVFSLARGRLYGTHQVRRAVRWSNFVNIFGMTAVAAGALIGVPVELLVGFLAAAYVLFALVNRRQTGLVRPGPALRREVHRFTVLVVAGTLASTGLLEASMLLAAAVGTPTEAGHYGAAFVLATPAALIGSAASLVLFPALSAASARRTASGAPAEGHLVDRASRLLAALVMPLFACLVLLCDPLVRIVWGENFRGTGAIVVPLLLAVCVTTLAIPAVNDLTTRSPRGVALSAALSGLGALCGCVSWVYLVPHHGMAGIGYGYLVGATVGSALSFAATWRTLRLRWFRHASSLTVALLFLGAASTVTASGGFFGSLGAELILLALFTVCWAAVNVPEYRWMLSTVRRMLVDR